MTIFTIGQSFVKSIGVFPGVRGTSLKIRPGLKELRDGLYVTQYKRLAAAVAHFTVFPRYVQGQRWKKSFPEGPEKN